MLWLLIITMLVASLSLLTPRNTQEKPYNNCFAFCKKLDEKMTYYYNWHMGFLKFYMNLFLPLTAAMSIKYVVDLFLIPEHPGVKLFINGGYAFISLFNLFLFRDIDDIAYRLNAVWLVCFIGIHSYIAGTGWIIAAVFYTLTAFCVFAYLHKRKDLFCNTKKQLKELYGETMAAYKED